MAEKANRVADTSGDTVTLNGAYYFLDQRPVTPEAAGIFYDTSGEPCALALRQCVPPHTQAGVEATAITTNRFSKPTIHKNTHAIAPKFGMELEVFRVQKDDGTYDTAADSGHSGLDLPELYRFMDEGGTEPAHDVQTLEVSLNSLVRYLAERAEKVDMLVMPAAVVGQREPVPSEQNPNLYVTFMTDSMEAKTGFNTVELFRVAGAQEHTNISNTEAMLKAGEAMQYLNPILMTASLAGPYLLGGRAGALADPHKLTDRQLTHMRRVGIKLADMQGPYTSWRYLLRRLASPAAGTWLTPAPDTTAEYLDRLNAALRDGHISTPDRLMGDHTDRIRSVLGGGHASTFEGCANDTFAGNPRTLLAAHVFKSALVTSLEARAIHGEDPRELVAKKLGIDCYTREQRLYIAHRMSLQASRYGNDALLYPTSRHKKGKLPARWLDDLLDLAQEAPHVQVTLGIQDQLRKMYASTPHTRAVMSAWCQKNNADVPRMAAYYALGYGNPAYYMQAVHDHTPGTEVQQVRAAEFDAACAFHGMVRVLDI